MAPTTVAAQMTARTAFPAPSRPRHCVGTDRHFCAQSSITFQLDGANKPRSKTDSGNVQLRSQTSTKGSKTRNVQFRENGTAIRSPRGESSSTLSRRSARCIIYAVAQQGRWKFAQSSNHGGLSRVSQHAMPRGSSRTEDKSFATIEDDDGLAFVDDEGLPCMLTDAAKAVTAMALAAAMLFNSTGPALARAEGVNRPDLLPAEFTPVIDVAGFLSPRQEASIKERVTRLEQDTGFKLRVLAQNYPETPGLAVKNYWGVDDNTVVFVADPNTGNILNFNVGGAVDLNVPQSFWSRLAGKYGNIFYWRENGEDAAIEAAVIAIDTCLREPAGPRACATVQGPG